MKNIVNVAVVGLGQVGNYLFNELIVKKKDIELKTGKRVNVVAISAKNINKILSKIPVVGEIIIPKEVGEGLFGVSFKIKGEPENLKTTVNPVRTLTPRFIQKDLEKKN